MLKVSNREIKITRGDTGYLCVKATLDNGEPVKFYSGDSMRLTVREEPNNGSEALITVYGTMSNGDDHFTIKIQPSATKSVPVGRYSADIQLIRKNGDVFTLFPNEIERRASVTDKINFGNFWILPEVTI